MKIGYRGSEMGGFEIGEHSSFCFGEARYCIEKQSLYPRSRGWPIVISSGMEDGVDVRYLSLIVVLSCVKTPPLSLSLLIGLKQSHRLYSSIIVLFKNQVDNLLPSISPCKRILLFLCDVVADFPKSCWTCWATTVKSSISIWPKKRARGYYLLNIIVFVEPVTKDTTC